MIFQAQIKYVMQIFSLKPKANSESVVDKTVNTIYKTQVSNAIWIMSFVSWANYFSVFAFFSAVGNSKLDALANPLNY